MGLSRVSAVLIQLMLWVPQAAASPSAQFTQVPSGVAPAWASAGELSDPGWQAQVVEGLELLEYSFQHVAGELGVWSAPNRAQDLRSRISTAGLEVFPRETSVDAACATWVIRLRTASFGRKAATVGLSGPFLTIAGRRAEIDHGVLREWFENRVEGIEHGWTIESSPAGDGPLAVDIAVLGVQSVSIDSGGHSADFLDADGRLMARYRDLIVHDATGLVLDSCLTPLPQGLCIEIVDQGAAYPVTIDPVLTGPAWTAEANQNGAQLGASIASAGDVNRDGYDDVIVGAPNYDAGSIDAGKAFVFLGSAAGLSTGFSWHSAGSQNFAHFGNSVASAGDVNADGYGDVIVGAWGFDSAIVIQGKMVGYRSNSGRATLFLGSPAGLSSVPAWTKDGLQSPARYGASVSSAGDVNHDGYGDVLVGADRHSNGHLAEGRVHLYLGSPSGLATTAAWTAEPNVQGASFGISVASAGDLNGDAYDDVIIGASRYANGEASEGAAFAYLGSSSGLTPTPAWSAEGGQSGARLGCSVASAGDVNGDTYDDVIVGAKHYDGGQVDSGRVMLFLGSSSGLAPGAAWIADGDQANAWLGSSVASAGDVNEDGFGDIVVGAPMYDHGQLDEGRAYFYRGSASGLSATPSWIGESNQFAAHFGDCVAGAGDVDGDGHDDALVGSSLWESTPGQKDEGRGWLFRGAALGLSSAANWTYESGQAHSGFGVSVASAGDVNGDGFDEVLVGAFAFDNGENDEGMAFLYSGSVSGPSTTPSWTAEADQSSSHFGSSVGTAGDVNGDGYADVVVGAVGYDVTSPDGGEGQAYLYLGGASGLSSAPAWTALGEGQHFSYGNVVGTAGDVNGDGFDDVLIASYGYDYNQGNKRGRVYVYHGFSSGLPGLPSWTVTGAVQNMSNFGFSAASAGDVNGDGFDDLIIGAHGYSNGQPGEGRALVYHGSATGLGAGPAWTAESNLSSVSFGYSAASAGDVNGDGFDDAIIGAPTYWNVELHEGRAYVFHGSAIGLGLNPAWTAESNLDRALLGYSVSSAGDVNGDGFGDVIVGSRDNSGISYGRAFVYHGSPSGLPSSADWMGQGTQFEEYYGEYVACAGDVNGDEYSDVIVSGRLYGNDNEGRVYLYFGNRGP